MTKIEDKILFLTMELASLKATIAGYDSTVQILRTFIEDRFLGAIDEMKVILKDCKYAVKLSKEYSENYASARRLVDDFDKIREFTQSKYENIENLIRNYMKDEESKTKEDKKVVRLRKAKEMILNCS